jgi:hypothetical protein
MESRVRGRAGYAAGRLSPGENVRTRTAGTPRRCRRQYRAPTTPPTPGALGAHVDAPARRCELHGVGQEVPHDLLQPRRVAVNRCVCTAELRAERDALLARRRADDIERLLDERDEVDVRLVEFEHAPGYSGEVQRFVHEPHQQPRIPFECARGPLDHFPLFRRALQTHRPAEDRLQRRPQLVRERRDEVVLDPIRLLGRRCRRSCSRSIASTLGFSAGAR